MDKLKGTAAAGGPVRLSRCNMRPCKSWLFLSNGATEIKITKRILPTRPSSKMAWLYTRRRALRHQDQYRIIGIFFNIILKNITLSLFPILAQLKEPVFLPATCRILRIPARRTARSELQLSCSTTARTAGQSSARPNRPLTGWLPLLLL